MRGVPITETFNGRHQRLTMYRADGQVWRCALSDPFTPYSVSTGRAGAIHEMWVFPPFGYAVEYITRQGGGVVITYREAYRMILEKAIMLLLHDQKVITEEEAGYSLALLHSCAD